MKIQEVRNIAKEKGIKTTRMNKADLIRAIQLAEGNFDCFGSPIDGFCDQMDCVWRDDCLPVPVAP